MWSGQDERSFVCPRVIDENWPCPGARVHGSDWSHKDCVHRRLPRIDLRGRLFELRVGVLFLKSKTQVLSMFLDYKNLMENFSGVQIMRIRSDNGSEFMNKRMATVCRNYGIVHKKSVPRSPQQNGVAERMNRTLIEKARCMLHCKVVPTKWWAEVVSIASYLSTSASTNLHITPYKLFFGKKPNLEQLRVLDRWDSPTMTSQSVRCWTQRGLSAICMLMRKTRRDTRYSIWRVTK